MHTFYNLHPVKNYNKPPTTIYPISTIEKIRYIYIYVDIDTIHIIILKS